MQWVIILIIIAVVVISPGFFSSNTPSPETGATSPSQDIDRFNGTNLEIFPKLTRIPVDYVDANDGDTITVRLNRHNVKVRYLMINTPEMNYEGGTAHPDFMAQEAFDRNVALLKKAKQVYMALDKGPTTDNYGRALAYIYADDQLVSEMLIREGLGTVRYVNPPNNTLEDVLRKAESQAKAESIGLWQE